MQSLLLAECVECKACEAPAVSLPPSGWLLKRWWCCRCRKLPEKIGDALTPQQYKDIEELGILADKDDQVLYLLLYQACCAPESQHCHLLSCICFMGRCLPLDDQSCMDKL